MYNQLIAREPGVDVYNNRGYLYYEHGYYEEALHDIQQAVRLDSLDFYAQQSLGEILGRMGNEPRALAQLDWLIRRWPENSGSWWARGEYFHHTQQWERAIPDLQKAVALGDGPATAQLLQEARDALATPQL